MLRDSDEASTTPPSEMILARNPSAKLPCASQACKVLEGPQTAYPTVGPVHSSVPIGDHGTPHSCGKTCAAGPLDDHEADLLGGAVGPALECVFFVTYLHLLDICQGAVQYLRADSIVTARCTMTLNSCS